MADHEASDLEQSPSTAELWSRLPQELQQQILSELATSSRHFRRQDEDRCTTRIPALLTFERGRHDHNDSNYPPPYQRMVHIILCKQQPDFALFLGLSRRDTTLIDRALSGGGYPGSMQFCRFSTAWPGYSHRFNTLINALAAAIRFHCFGYASLFITEMAQDYQYTIAQINEDDSEQDSAAAASDASDHSDDDSDSDEVPPAQSGLHLESTDSSDSDADYNDSDNNSNHEDGDELEDIYYGRDLKAFNWCTWAVGPDGKPFVSFGARNRSRSPLFEFIRAVEIGPVAVYNSESIDMAESLKDGRVLLDLLLTQGDTLTRVDRHLPLYSELNDVIICASRGNVPVEYFNKIVSKVGHRILHYNRGLTDWFNWSICFSLIADVILEESVLGTGNRGPDVDYVPPSSQAGVLSKIQCILQACHDHNYFNTYHSRDADLKPFVTKVTLWVMRQQDLCFGAKVFKLLFTGSLAWPEAEVYARQTIDDYMELWGDLCIEGDKFCAENLLGLLSGQ